MRITQRYHVEYSGKDPWGERYSSCISFDSEAKADAYIEKLKADERISYISKTVTTSYIVR